MIETTLSKVGNSLAVLLPKALRQAAEFDIDTQIRLETPRKGVVVITSVMDDSDRSERLQAAEARIQKRSKHLDPWPQGKSAEDLINEEKGAMADELLSL